MAKQLFNSSEKSNFILNMTEEKYAEIASWGLISACLMTSLAMSVPVIFGNRLDMLASAGLAVSGVFCMILALIGAMKKYISRKLVIPICGMGIIFLWAVISMIFSYDIYVSLNGYPGRGEGLLAIVFYICFFFTGAAVKSKKARERLIYGILANGLLNSIVGLIQIFTGQISSYTKIGYEVEVNAASGLSQSPLFLAMVLSISIAAALMGFLILDNKKTKIVCIVSACIFSFVIMFTYSLIGICGTALAVISAMMMIFAAKAPKINLLSLLSVIIPAAAAVCIVQAGVIGSINSYRLYDGRILWFADSYMGLTSSGYFPDSVDIDDTEDVYYTLNRRTMDIISGNALTGTGPDQLIYPQIYTYGPNGSPESSMEDMIMYNKGTFDKVYNEYLNTAATRGIPSALALVIVLASVIITGIVKYKKSRNSMTLCMTMITSIGALIFLIGCSNTAFSPIFWAAAGCAVSSAGDKSGQ
ncbi:MAG: hypothetical protein K2J37_06365 [Ruminococcus sp.]|nr:hypothetical protein [Ruminococcus sp.]